MLAHAADLTIDGGLVIAVEHEWAYGSSWTLPYETRGLKTLRDDPNGSGDHPRHLGDLHQVSGVSRVVSVEVQGRLATSAVL